MIITNFQVLDSIIDFSEGDLRKAITLLQSAYRLKGDESITVDDITDISGVSIFTVLNLFHNIRKIAYWYALLLRTFSKIGFKYYLVLKN